MLRNEFHLVVHIWITNSNGKFLIAKRAAEKPNGGMWETTGGSAIAGESSIEAALRETKEELGIELNPKNCRHLTRIKRVNPDLPDFVDAWICHSNIEISKLKPEPSEVSEVKWAAKEEIKEMINRKEFLDVFPYLDMVFK